jgi:hypothetical protein
MEMKTTQKRHSLPLCGRLYKAFGKPIDRGVFAGYNTKMKMKTDFK